MARTMSAGKALGIAVFADSVKPSDRYFYGTEIIHQLRKLGFDVVARPAPKRKKTAR